LFRYVIRETTTIERILMLAAGLMMVLPEAVTSLGGLALVALVILLQKKRPRDGSLAL
jgi:TRAP-type uncharacterized transport system fused permease subunit